MQRMLSTQPQIPPSEIVEHATLEEMLDAFNSIPNGTLYAINFSNSTVYDQPMIPILPPKPGVVATIYVVYFNDTSGDMVLENLAVQTLIDNAIATLRLGLPNQEIFTPYIQGWPKPESKHNGQLSVFTYSGPQFFCICSMIILVISLYSLVIEKEHRLRFGMKMMGLRDTAFYLSWFISFTIMCFITTLITMFSGMIFQIDMFIKSNWFVMFAMFFTFGMCLVCLAFLLSTLVNTGKSALILGFLILAVTFILNMFVGNGAAVYRLYSSIISPAVPRLLSLYPPYDFAKIFSDISYMTLPQYDQYSRKYIPGPGYSWADLYKENTYFGQQAPPTANSFYILLGLSAGFLIIAWYLDNVLPGATGIARKPWFFLTPSFYGIQFGKSNESNTPENPKIVKLPKDDPIRIEYENVHNPNNAFALKIMNLQKSYDKWFGLVRSHQALKGLNLGIYPGTCIGYLGVNGAGKSTTMNILTGLIKPTGGDTFIFNKSVRTNMDLIRKHIGVCPQHDILWDDLTAKEHLLLFGLLKGVPLKKLNPMINTLLTKVNLLDVKNRPAGTFSGGMKRRLSVCIACIGEPELILLDEPTTGMDPFSRRQVWDLIQEMKTGNRVIILTTHSMDEAEALCDRIAIMADGELQAIGDGLSLKNQFGSGYTLTLVSYAGRAAEIQKLAEQNLPPESKLVSENAGSFIYQIPKHRIEELPSFLEKLEAEAEREGTALKDWGIAHTTLEQVYLVVNKLADEKRQIASKQKKISKDEIPDVVNIVELQDINSDNIKP
jgi:ABC-type multidrug transport system ATPase subunit